MVLGALDRVAELHEPTPNTPYPTPHGQYILEVRRRPVTQPDLSHGQENTLFLQLFVTNPGTLHVLRSSQLTPDEIGPMVGDAHLIRLAVAHLDISGGNVFAHVCTDDPKS